MKNMQKFLGGSACLLVVCFCALMCSTKGRHLKRARKFLVGLLCMATALLCAPNATVKADPINSNSVVQAFPNESKGVDVPVEFYIQTDKSTYQLGETVDILYRVSNLGSTDVPIEIPAQARDLDIWVRQEGDTLWRALGAVPPGSILIPSFVTLAFGETLELEWTWDMKDFYASPLSPGDYDVFGMFGSWTLYDGATVIEHGIEVGVSITIIPEPTSLLLIAIAFFGACLKRN